MIIILDDMAHLKIMQMKPGTDNVGQLIYVSTRSAAV
jgi:hypothetical protein